MNNALFDRWDEIDPIIRSAVRFPEQERESFVHRATGHDVLLKDVVMQILGSDGHGFELDAASSEMVELLAEAFESSQDEGDHLLGRMVGPYRLQRLIGRGGMGAVYLASREDGLFKRTVALKLTRFGAAASDHSRQAAIHPRHIPLPDRVARRP